MMSVVIPHMKGSRAYQSERQRIVAQLVREAFPDMMFDKIQEVGKNLK